MCLLVFHHVKFSILTKTLYFRSHLKIKFLSVDCWIKHRACIWVLRYTCDNQRLMCFNVWNLYFKVSELYCFSTLAVESQHKYSPLVYYIETPHNEILWYSTHMYWLYHCVKLIHLLIHFLKEQTLGYLLIFYLWNSLMMT